MRTTADVNLPFGEDSSNAARVSTMFQYGKSSTVDQTTLQDFGFAPGVTFSIGTPTQITLQALLQHNHDQVQYGVPPLNGFPLRLVVPGWYATYWVKALTEITVLPKAFNGYWMEKAYRLATTPNGDETPDHLATKTVPISRMNVRSFTTFP